MHIAYIPKGRGKKPRMIYVPDEKEKKALRALLPQLTEIALRVCPPDAVHGFMPGRSAVTNAAAHVGRQFTACWDLKDFFDTVTWRHVQGLIPDELLDLVIQDGAARQGLPTSPLVANIAAAAMDKEILAFLLPGMVYTRYADDLSISFDAREQLDTLRTKLPETVERHRFTLNSAKTRVQWAKAGRRVITGVAVDGDTLYPSRRARRKLRAARHQGNPGSLAGLTEWCKLKPPRAHWAQLEAERSRIRDQMRLYTRSPVNTQAAYGKQRRHIDLDQD